ncbi:MAG: prepilin-type N-terminal cleavage/methylation domain-containing protein [Methylococcales bacterium]|jgi:type IV pilus assembly protein PilW|nr:prepilin-type N-terminal cleavage/methylation domain-containing protein [Methylococcales bacterium]MBT7444395.1 prepilin-type N-terminal cleavage/methylation domain-containing protein [Methylococcales bacterium]
MRVKHSGFTLIELLISVTLGAIIISGGLSILFSTKQNSAYQEALTSLQENGRIAEGVLSQSIRMAGFCENPDKSSGCFNKLSDEGAEGQDGDSGNPDTFTVRYQSTGSEKDCLGNTLSLGSNVTNTFFIQAKDADGNNITYDTDPSYQYDLVCTGSNGQTAAIVSGIEQLQLLFGVDTNGNDIANGYIPADLVTNWNAVVSVSMSFIVQHPAKIKRSVVSQEFDLLGTKVTFNDRRLRHQYDMRILMRNRVK